MSTAKRLDELYRKADRICLDNRTRIVLMSDCHRGEGNYGDNFLKNRPLVLAALSYYERRCFTYVELGDGDELWENRRWEPIVQAHGEVFRRLTGFYFRRRFFMLYGNHDREKENPESLKSMEEKSGLLQGLVAKEGLLLQDAATGDEILLVHGHQGDFGNDTMWRLSRFLVRHIWRRMELLGLQDPTSAAKNNRKKRKVEKRLAKWAEENKVLLIAGHTHRPVLPKPGESMYLNDGSCVHPGCITAMEIEQGYISLVRWCVHARADGSMYVGRERIAGPVRLREYFEKAR